MRSIQGANQTQTGPGVRGECHSMPGLFIRRLYSAFLLDGTAGSGGELVEDAEMLDADVTEGWVAGDAGDDGPIQVSFDGLRVFEQVDASEFAGVGVERPDFPLKARYLGYGVGERGKCLSQFFRRDTELEVDL